MLVRDQLQEIRTLGQHWRYIYSRRRRWHGVSTSQIIASQLFTVIVSVLAGLLFDLNKETIAFLVGALLLMPGIIDLSASLTGAMCAKINHQIDTTGLPTWVITVNSVIVALVVSILAGSIVGLVGGLLASWLFGAHVLTMVLLSVVSLSLIGLLSFPMMALFTLLIRRLNMNPDNISGPVESSVVDVIAIIVIALVVGLVIMKFRRDPLWFIVLTAAAASSVSLIGGIGIEAVAEKLLPLVPVVVALPALNTMVGDYATIIAAHAGDPFERARSRRQLIVAVGWSVLLNVIGVTVLSLLLASRRDFALQIDFVLRFGLFVACAIIVSVAFMFVITYALDRLLKKRHLNPDDLLIPVVTSVSDVLMLGMIAGGAVVLF